MGASASVRCVPEGKELSTPVPSANEHCRSVVESQHCTRCGHTPCSEDSPQILWNVPRSGDGSDLSIQSVLPRRNYRHTAQGRGRLFVHLLGLHFAKIPTARSALCRRGLRYGKRARSTDVMWNYESETSTNQHSTLVKVTLRTAGRRGRVQVCWQRRGDDDREGRNHTRNNAFQRAGPQHKSFPKPCRATAGSSAQVSEN